MDFNDVHDINEIKITVNGWVPLTVIFGIANLSNKSFLLWQIKNTSHIFKVDLRTVTSIHGGDYKEHFKKTLVNFRKDLIDYYYGRNTKIDMSRYINEFAQYIKELDN